VFHRDSWLWRLGIVGAVIVALASLSTGDPSNPLTLGYYGIPDPWAPYIRLAAFVIGIASGKLATSPLPGKADGAGAFQRKGRRS
jgi:hypothetical protein